MSVMDLGLRTVCPSWISVRGLCVRRGSRSEECVAVMDLGLSTVCPSWISV